MKRLLLKYSLFGNGVGIIEIHLSAKMKNQLLKNSQRVVSPSYCYKSKLTSITQTNQNNRCFIPKHLALENIMLKVKKENSLINLPFMIITYLQTIFMTMMIKQVSFLVQEIQKHSCKSIQSIVDRSKVKNQEQLHNSNLKIEKRHMSDKFILFLTFLAISVAFGELS